MPPKRSVVTLQSQGPSQRRKTPNTTQAESSEDRAYESEQEGEASTQVGEKGGLTETVSLAIAIFRQLEDVMWSLDPY